MHGELLLELAVGGGMPPAQSELLRIARDGGAVAVVGNAWPEGEPQDEVGLYRMELPGDTVAELERRLAADTADTAAGLFGRDREYGPRPPDSVANVLSLYRDGRETRIRWATHAKVPAALAEIRARLREILEEVRRHPVQTVRAELGAIPGPLAAGQPFDIELRLVNRGSQGIKLLAVPGAAGPVRFQLHAEPAAERSGRDALPLQLFHQAPAVAALPPSGGATGLTLAPGATVAVRGAAPVRLAAPGRYRLYGFATLRVEIGLDGEPLTLDRGFAIARPVEVELR